MPPAAKCAHENEGIETDERDHGEDREVAARPFDAGALAAPEDPETREQDPDDELEVVLRHPGEGPADDQTGDDDHHDRGCGCTCGKPKPSLGRAEGDHDTPTLGPLEQDALE